MSLNLCLQISLYFPPKMNVLATAPQLIFQMLIYNQNIYLFSNICIFRSLYTKYTSISISVHVCVCVCLYRCTYRETGSHSYRLVKQATNNIVKSRHSQYLAKVFSIPQTRWCHRMGGMGSIEREVVAQISSEPSQIPWWFELCPVTSAQLCTWCLPQGAVSIRKTVFPGMAIPMLKIRRPSGRLIFNMEIAIRR